MNWFIPGNVPSSKNGKRWTGNYLISSKATMQYRKDTKQYYQNYKQQFITEFAKHTKPVYVSFTFIRKSKHKFDYINPLQTVQDDMVKNEWLEDDDCSNILPVFEEYVYDKNNPGVIIKIINKDEYRKLRAKMGNSATED